MRLRRGRTKSKTVERYLLAKRPDWQSVSRPAGPSVQKRCSMNWPDKPPGTYIGKVHEAQANTALTSVPVCLNAR